eukprot:12407139-Karenia_brevis.AAC.1
MAPLVDDEESPQLRAEIKKLGEATLNKRLPNMSVLRPLFSLLHVGAELGPSGMRWHVHERAEGATWSSGSFKN